jgi:CelD/BcsL family acetyltransferase involved in cellulose biosynthesis
MGASEAPGALLLDTRDERWRRLVESHPAATPFHDAAWTDALTRCYGFEAFIAAVPDAGSGVAAGVPLMRVRGPSGRRAWVALPFTDACAPLASGPETERALGDALRGAAARARVGRLEVRAPVPGLAQAAVAVSHVLDLSPGPQALERAFHQRVRRNARRARRAGVTIRAAGREEDLTRTFYALLLRTRRRLGVPVQPRRLLRSLWRAVIAPGRGELLLAEAGGAPIAGIVLLHGARTTVYKYGASDERALALRPNDLLMSEAVLAAAGAGREAFDFGRSDSHADGLRRFKSGFGAAERPLVYSALRTPAPPGGPARLLEPVIRRSPPAVCRLVGETLYRFAA